LHCDGNFEKQVFLKYKKMWIVVFRTQKWYDQVTDCEMNMGILRSIGVL